MMGGMVYDLFEGCWHLVREGEPLRLRPMKFVVVPVDGGLVRLMYREPESGGVESAKAVSLVELVGCWSMGKDEVVAAVRRALPGVTHVHDSGVWP